MKTHLNDYLVGVIIGIIFIIFATTSVFIDHQRIYGYSYFVIGSLTNLVMMGIGDFSIVWAVIIAGGIFWIYSRTKFYTSRHQGVSKFKSLISFFLGVLTVYAAAIIFFVMNFHIEVL